MSAFTLKIVTPDGEKFSGEAKSILVRTDGGDVQILRGHADYFAPLGTGKAKITLDSGDERLAACSGGFISVLGGEVNLVATTFEYAEEIDIARAEDAKVKAEAAIKALSDDKLLRVAKAKLARAINRISVGNE